MGDVLLTCSAAPVFWWLSYLLSTTTRKGLFESSRERMNEGENASPLEWTELCCLICKPQIRLDDHLMLPRLPLSSHYVLYVSLSTSKLLSVCLKFLEYLELSKSYLTNQSFSLQVDQKRIKWNTQRKSFDIWLPSQKEMFQSVSLSSFYGCVYVVQPHTQSTDCEKLKQACIASCLSLLHRRHVKYACSHPTRTFVTLFRYPICFFYQ